MSPAARSRGGRGGRPEPRGGRRPAAGRGPSPRAQRALRRGPLTYVPRLVLGRLNYALMGAGAVAIVAGFLLLAAEEISLSPVLLVLGYCVLIPAGLLIERVPGRGGEGGPEGRRGPAGGRAGGGSGGE